MKAQLLLLLPLLFVACQQQTPPPSDQSLQLYQNFTVLITGNMALAFGNAFGELEDELASTFAEAASADGVASIDAQIRKMDAEVLEELGDMMDRTEEAFDRLETDQPELHRELLSSEVLTEGLSIVQNLPLPPGFEPLTEPRTNQELTRYVAFLAVSGGESNHEVHRLYSDLFAWYQRVASEFQDNPEFNAFSRSVRESAKRAEDVRAA